MNYKTGKYLFISIIVISLLAFAIWLFYNPVQNFSLSIPGQDKRPPHSEDTSLSVKIGEKFTFIKEINSQLTGKWSRFRGADFDNINKENIPLLSSFGASGPKILWKTELGEGHAAAAIFNGKVFVLDYNEAKKCDVLKCLSLENGEELWRRFYGVHIKRNHGISRTIPAVTDKYVVSIGPKGHVMCVNTVNGEFLWGIDLEKEYATEIPFWNTGQCPVIYQDVAVIAVGGKVLMMGIDCKTGKKIWETPNPDHWKMSHSSVMPMTVNGKRMWVYAAIGGVCGISAEGSDVGNLLWKTTEYSPNVIAPSPVVMDKGRIFITAGYGAGSAVLKVDGSGNNFNVKVLQKYLPLAGLASEQQSPIFYKGFLFGIQPKDAGAMRNQFVCCKPDDCKKILWSSGQEIRFGLGPYIIADGKFFILDDDGTLTIAEANTGKFVFLSKTKILDGQDAWGPLAIADGKLILRDSKTMVCVDIRK